MNMVLGLQGKFINDNQVLLDAAHAAGVADAEKVVEDESLEAATVRFMLFNVA